MDALNSSRSECHLTDVEDDKSLDTIIICQLEGLAAVDIRVMFKYEPDNSLLGTCVGH